MLQRLKNGFNNHVTNYVPIAPLAIVRIAFGAIMLISILRFIFKGWVTEFYIKPSFHFTFYGFDWVKPFGEIGMFTIYGLLLLSSLFVLLGLFYRISIVTFFLCFTYTELIDKTYYLNHYYFISIISFLLILVPAHRYFSLDILRNPTLKKTMVPAWTINLFKLQLFIVYFFAGISKLTYEWLFEAMPLKIWLPANSHLPLVGPFLSELWIAYFFSWFGAVYDLLIGFLLWNKFTRKFAYILVVIFHVFTGWFFKIGMFPFIMILLTLVFFSASFHQDLIQKIRSIFGMPSISDEHSYYNIDPAKRKLVFTFLIVYVTIQLLLPFRYALYPGKLYWTEEGYRFSWRVMLMEKGGTCFFYVKDPESGKQSEIVNSQYLTAAQEKMMSTQPDMILQYARFLDEEYRKKGIKDPIITVESYVTLNGSGSRLFIDKNTDLSKEEESLLPKTWILPFKKN